MADLDIAAFLRARETEREASAQADLADPSSLHARRKRAEWTLADVKAKRQIVELCVTETDETGGRPLAIRTLRLLALPYVGHPEFREEWKL